MMFVFSVTGKFNTIHWVWVFGQLHYDNCCEYFTLFFVFGSTITHMSTLISSLFDKSVAFI